MTTATQNVTMKGNAITLSGTPVSIGSPAPDCSLTANDLSEVKLSDFKGKKIILSVTPSLDTPVCDLQAKHFNQKAENLGDDVVVINISADLPFAQKRWCAATNSENIKTLSDHKDMTFGKSYGVLIENVRILARAVFIIDKDFTIQYIQIVPEVTSEPKYDEVLSSIKNL